MSELPSGWARGSLSDVLRIRNGYAFKSAEFKLEGIPLVRQSNLDGDKVDLSKCVYLDEQYLIERAGFTLHKGDVLIGMSGSVGKLCTYDQDFAALQNQRVGKIELHAPDQTEWRFIWHYLKTVTDALLDKAKGVAVANVSPDDIHSLPLNIPPLAEQTRIAQKLDELLAQVDTLKARIDAIPALLKRFRQSVLAAAVSGRLTEEWRTQNVGWVDEGSPTTAPSHETEHRASEAQPNLPDNLTALVLASREQGEIPCGWQWKMLVNLAKLESGHTPRKSIPAYWENGDVPWLSLQDIRASDGKEIHQTKHMPTMLGIENSSARLLPEGTVCFCRDISVGYVTIMGKPMSTTQHFANWICKEELIPKYLMFAFMASREHLTRSGQGSTVKTIYMPALKELRLSLPPLEEQTEIVRRVEQLFAFTDQLEAKIKSAQARVNQLTQSILAKAFRGELVPQDPNDEPASVLLERIKAQRAAAPKAKRGRKASA